jgi:hypothetical protein
MEPLEVRLPGARRRCVCIRMRAVRPCCAVHPSTEAFGRPARETWSASKSLPQEEPTVAGRFYCSVFLHQHDPLWMHSARRVSNRPASPSQLCERPPFTIFPALRRESRHSGCQFCQRRICRAEARALPLRDPSIIQIHVCLPRFDLFLGVLRMANRSEAAFSPKRH